MTHQNTFAITYTVKNEANLLPDAIAYHLAMGCSRIYVFFDGTTDNSRELIQGIDRVVCADSISPGALTSPPEWVDEIVPRWGESMDVRKRINTLFAADQAKTDGIEWLINIDPDELLILNDQATNSLKNTEAFFTPISAQVDQILIPNLEAIPTSDGSGKPYIDCTLFLERFPITELLWRFSLGICRKIVSNPKYHAWADYWFYHLRFRGALPRLMKHPVTQESIPAGYFLGYSNHKSFIRTAVARDFKFNIHRWEKVTRKPRNTKKGKLLHYDLPSTEYFCAKFRQRPPAMLVKAFYCRYQFAQIARELPFEAARQFFLNNICISDTAIINRMKRNGILTEIKFIADFMKERATNLSK
jgi:hypothetical protein